MSTEGFFNCFKTQMLSGDVNLANAGDELKIALFTSSFVFDATKTTYGALANEATAGTGYTAGGAVLADQALSGTATVKFDATDATWTASGGTIVAAYAVIYDATNTNSLICCIDLGGSQTAADGDPFTVQFSSNGIIQLT